MDWKAGYAKFLSSLKRRLSFEDLAGQRLRRPVELTSDLDAFLNDLCSYYLSASDDSRSQIRSAFDDADAIWYLYEFGKRMTDRLLADKKILTLRVALAASSIADQRPDYRDALYRLGYLYKAAQQAGITDPMLHFRAAAQLSNNTGRRSTAWLLATFDQTKVYQEFAER